MSYIDPIGKLIKETPKSVQKQHSKLIRQSGGLGEGQQEEFSKIFKTVKAMSKKKISEEECRKSILEMKRFNELVPFREISLPRRKEIETARNKEGIGKDKKSMNDGL